MNSVKPPLVRAGELAEYGFCERAWWLARVKNFSSQKQPALTRGLATHAYHHKQVQNAIRWRRMGLFLFGAGGTALVIIFLLNAI